MSAVLRFFFIGVIASILAGACTQLLENFPVECEDNGAWSEGFGCFAFLPPENVYVDLVIMCIQLTTIYIHWITICYLATERHLTPTPKPHQHPPTDL